MRFGLRAALIVLLSLSLSRPAKPESIDTAGKQIYTGIAVAAAAIGVLVIVLVVRHKNRSTTTMTGCVQPGANGMSVKSEKDQRTYSIAGDATGVRAGERMKLEGHSRKGLVFEAHGSSVDLGACSN